MILARESVIGSIIEKRNVFIENVNYPDVYSYGETPPIPTASHFRMTEGTSFSYEWFIDKTPYGSDTPCLIPFSGTPKDVGNYVLRAYAGSNGILGASYVDVKVNIVPALVTVEYVIDSDAICYEYNGTNYYFVDSMDQISVKLDGFVYGDTVESLGLNTYVEAYREANTLREYPSRKNVDIDYVIEGEASNYEFALKENSPHFYVSLPGVGLPSIIEEEYSYEYDWSSGYLEENWGFRYEFTWDEPVVDGFEIKKENGEYW